MADQLVRRYHGLAHRAEQFPRCAAARTGGSVWFDSAAAIRAKVLLAMSAHVHVWFDGLMAGRTMSGKGIVGQITSP